MSKLALELLSESSKMSDDELAKMINLELDKLGKMEQGKHSLDAFLKQAEKLQDLLKEAKKRNLRLRG